MTARRPGPVRARGGGPERVFAAARARGYELPAGRSPPADGHAGATDVPV